MNNESLVWLASYPRSGNTLLRTILWQCFGLRSASIYRNDLGGNQSLERYVGHIEHDAQDRIAFPEGAVPLIKTHAHARDANRAIYVIRDGRAACVSLWKFWKEMLPLEEVIAGEHQFGSWASHVQSWSPWDRPDTLVLRYEDMLDRLPDVLQRIEGFLGREAVSDHLPDRNTIAEQDGRWVRARTDWRTGLRGDLLREFNRLNEEILMKAGYLDE